MIVILAVPVVASVVMWGFAGLTIIKAIATHSQTAQNGTVLIRIALADAVGLAAILIAAVFMGWFTRRLSRDVSSLETSARHFADQQLPQLVQRLRRGEKVDPETEVSSPARVKITEVARADAALASLQRAALEAAITETSLRSAISQVFVSLARRSSRCCSDSCGCWTTWNARRLTPERWRTCSRWTTSRPGCAATPRA